MTTSKLLLGILGAAAAGVIVGILIAPEKGSDLRESIKKTAGDWADDVNDWMGKGKEYLSELKGKVSSQAEDLREEGEDAVNSLKGNLRKRSSYQG
ncbi:YtxH domain-containing protein [Pseudochryseolinea flava]|uniref:YtxH domain-containing protein n=1 Tax=Pseudochryseolinea flava TaxID=2059302 RepID=A0A364Y7G3_9BACT|nr:YtxH domain-containing protein [Pseudochryseolinea flava]RAW01764.1 YtxH domain-containing protein [Pseudochryseolinea flava]